MSCCNTSKKLCEDSECSTCHSRSFATHPRAKFWSDKNTMGPHEVLRSSNKKYIFDCEECGHELEMILKNVVSGQWCKYCNGNGLCQSESCKFCYNRSFASHPMAIAWSLKNTIKPRDILKGSDKRFWFDCPDCEHDISTIKLKSII